jgi:hypothetical protein
MLIFSTESPKLYEIARRYLVMSALEPVCKAHKVVHTKVRNRLKNKTFHEFYCCYVNLRLIKKIQDEVDNKNSATKFPPLKNPLRRLSLTTSKTSRSRKRKRKGRSPSSLDSDHDV